MTAEHEGEQLYASRLGRPEGQIQQIFAVRQAALTAKAAALPAGTPARAAAEAAVRSDPSNPAAERSGIAWRNSTDGQKTRQRYRD
ncbi:hypothetical protein ABIB15_002133 [Marisediminicola sp. UYEF4]|uniref:hypothetical protein n=1 Tax=Marisediminicola sp. UYEF4 TaxID=1756384 RepID=UPI0033912E08